MKNAQDIEVFLFQENSLSLEILVNYFFLLFNRLGLSVDFLKDHSHEVHLTFSESLHLLNAFIERLFINRGFEALNNSFVIQKLLLLKLPLYLFWVKEGEGIRDEFKVLVWFIEHHERVVRLSWNELLSPDLFFLLRILAKILLIIWICS